MAILDQVDSNNVSSESWPSPLNLQSNMNQQVMLAQMRPREGLGYITDLGEALNNAASSARRNLPPGLSEGLGVLQNTPPDAIAAGAVINLPGNRKMGLFLIQPTQPNNPLAPDLSKPPTVFFSVPSMGIVGTYNPNNNQVELGGGATMPVTGVPNTVFFYNVRQGGRGDENSAVSSTSGNFGFLNSTVSDPIAKFVIDRGSQGITAIARALQGAGLLGDVVSGPSGEGAVGAVTVELFRNVVIGALKQNTKFFVGPAWRGADFEQYPNGETNLNLSGAKFRFSMGEGAGGSGLPSSAFVTDLPQILGSFGELGRNDVLPSTTNQNARSLGYIVHQSYLEAGQNSTNALGWTRSTYENAGRAGLEQRALEVLSQNAPNSVNDRAFVRIGMGEQAATLAKGIYDHLRQNGDQNGETYSPQQAWSAVWANYISGNSVRVDSSGLAEGGNAGGMNALIGLAQNIGLDPAPYLPREMR